MQGQPFTEICFDLDLCLFSQALLKQKTDNEGFGQGFTEWSTKTLTFYLETCFKVTAMFFPTRVNYKPDWAKGSISL